MKHLWKFRLSLVAIMGISLSLMVYSFEQVPDHKLMGLGAFLVFFAAAMVLLYTSHMDERPVPTKKRKHAPIVHHSGPEHHFRSMGGGSGGSSGC